MFLSSEAGKVVIRGGRLVDTRAGRVLEGWGVVLDAASGRIEAAGPLAALRYPEGAQVLEAGEATLLPGLIDAHVHLTATAEAGPAALLAEMRRSVPQLTLLAAENARKTVEAGFTTVRDAGDAAGVVVHAIRDAVEEGRLPGPRIRSSGYPLSITGGHGDIANGWPEDVLFLRRRVADGVDEVRRAAREELRRGADQLKLMASGGVMSEGDSPRARGFTEEEMRAAVEEAHNVGKPVMAHAQATGGIRNALRAGVDSVEHGFFFDDECVELLQARGAWLVPTLVAVRRILEHGERGGIPAANVAKARLGAEAHLESFRRVREAGGRIALGTDAGTPFNPNGANAAELGLMVEAGMTPMEALVAATRSGAELLGVEAGILEPGRWADVLVVRGDPLADIRLLEDRSNILAVFKAGRPVFLRDVELRPAGAPGGGPQVAAGRGA